MRAADLIIQLFQRFCWLDDGLQARLHAKGWPDVSHAQSMVMINLVTGVTRPSEIARRLGVSRQAIHTTIAQMIDKGIVTLEADPQDARHRQLVLTAFGARMRNDAQEAVTALAGEVANRIGAARFDALLDALDADWGKP